jgi:hypothetical protein
MTKVTLYFQLKSLEFHLRCIGSQKLATRASSLSSVTTFRSGAFLGQGKHSRHTRTGLIGLKVQHVYQGIGLSLDFVQDGSFALEALGQSYKACQCSEDKEPTTAHLLSLRSTALVELDNEREKKGSEDRHRNDIT